MKDILGREAKVGDLFAYALTVGRSANMAVYELREIKNGKPKAHKIVESYGGGGDIGPAHRDKDGYIQHMRTHKFVYIDSTIGYGYVPKTEEELAKDKAACVTLSKFEERAVILPPNYLDNLT